MEVLSSIWSALCSENVELMKIIAIPCSILEIMLSMILFTNILNISSNKSQKFAYVFTFSAISIITSHFIQEPFSVIINYASLFILTFLIFKLDIVKNFIALVASIAVYGLINTLLLNPYLKVLNISYEIYSITPIFKIGYITILYIVIALICICLKKFYIFKLTLLDELDKKTKNILIFNLFLGIFVLCVQVTISFYYIDIYPIVFTILNFILLLAYFILSVYSLSRATKLVITTRSLESAEEYNKSLKYLYGQVEGFQHDLNNIVSTIDGYIEDNDMEGLKDYFKRFKKDCTRAKNVALLNPMNVNNPGIYNLINTEYHRAIEKDITVNIHFLLDLSKLDIKTYEFSRMLGILLDNAIEAASECEEKTINIDFRDEPKRHRGIISIENTYKNKDVDIDKIFEKGVSSKKHPSGIGLYEVREYIRKSNNLNLFTTKNDNFFRQQLEIYY